MTTVFRIVAMIICIAVGLVALLMASKNLRAKGLLPFHEQVVGRPWEDLDEGSRSVIPVLMRLTGLGFAVVGLQLVVLAPIAAVASVPVLGFVAASAGLLYCFGLFVINYQLHSAKGVTTPWRGAVYSSIALALGAVLFVV